MTQAVVDRHFDAAASFWSEIYSATDVYGVIHQHRLALALAWIDELRPAPGTDVLEVGCGAGLTAVALARRGLHVLATDAAPGMVEATRAAAQRAGVAARIEARRGDVHALDLPDGGFRVVIALGVVPFLTAPHTALAEIARVLEPGGWLVASADNAARLTGLADPRTNPRLEGVRRRLKRRLGVRLSEEPAEIVVTRHATGELDALLAAAGLAPVKGRTFGFGPFTVLGREVLPRRAGVLLHRGLQRLADRGVPGLRSTGSQHLVLARKR